VDTADCPLGADIARPGYTRVGVTTDQTSLTAFDGMLTYMQQHTGAWQGVTYWAGGPWWGNYMFSIEPQNGVDKPQMGIAGLLVFESDGKQDAAAKLMKRFELDDEQVDAILELKLYKLARLEILVIQKEAKEKRAEATRLAGVLKDSRKRWAVVTDELRQVKERYADARRTKIGGGGDDVEYSEENQCLQES